VKGKTTKRNSPKNFASQLRNTPYLRLLIQRGDCEPIVFISSPASADKITARLENRGYTVTREEQ
jgi:hypothetical protein